MPAHDPFMAPRWKATYPWASAPPEHLNDGRATHESFVQLMDENGIEKAAAGRNAKGSMVGTEMDGASDGFTMTP